MKRGAVSVALVVGLLMVGPMGNMSAVAQGLQASVGVSTSTPDFSLSEAGQVSSGVAVGLGVAAVPDYEGSEDYEGVLVPYLNAHWSNHMWLRWLGGNAKVSLVPSATWNGGVVGEYIKKRDNVDNNKVDRMKNVDASFMLGGFFGFDYQNWSAYIELMGDAADGNDGTIVRLNASYKIPIEQTWSLTLGAFTTWADNDYMEAYFEVDSADSRRSGLKKFNADSGFKDVGLNFAAAYKPWEHWGLMGLVSYKRLLGDAADSPVVDDVGDENQFAVGALVIYSF